MHKTNRIWDVLVLWPFIYFALLIVFAIIMSVLATGGADPDAVAGIMVALGSLFVLIHFSSIVLMVVVYIYAIHRLYTTTKLPDKEKRTWLILVVIFNILAIPVLHFMHLRK